MQKEFIKNIYKEFVYCDPNEHLLNPNNTLTRPVTNSKHILKSTNPPEKAQFINIQSEITGDNNNSEITVVTPKLQETTLSTTQSVSGSRKPTKTEEEVIHKKKSIQKEPKSEPIVYDEETFNQIELRGFITKDLLRMSLDKGSNLFHIAEEIFEKLVDRYNQFKEILHTLETEFDNTVECIIETGKELSKKINHIIYQLYLAIMERHL